jgi:hypothetical protein
MLKECYVKVNDIMFKTNSLNMLIFKVKSL